jgi:hypothetical protein
VRPKFNLFYLLFYLFAMSCGRQGENCIYLIPKDYEGNLIIIFDQKEGKDPVYDNQTRVYTFDQSGVLKTKFKVNYGIQQNQYYYVDSVGTRTNIKYNLPSQATKSNDYVVLILGTGNNFDTAQKIKRHFELLTVARQYHVDSIANLSSNFMWSVLRQ